MPDAGDSLQSKYSAPGVSWLNNEHMLMRDTKTEGLALMWIKLLCNESM